MLAAPWAVLVLLLPRAAVAAPRPPKCMTQHCGAASQLPAVLRTSLVELGHDATLVDRVLAELREEHPDMHAAPVNELPDPPRNLLLSRLVNAIFVYGTLRGDFSSQGDKWGVIRRTGAAWQPARVNGYNLYQRKDLFYPFVVPAADGAGTVIGNLLTWPDDKLFQSALEECDQIEGFDVETPERGLYRRSVVQAELPGSKMVPAYIYWQNVDVEHIGVALTAFPGGDWLHPG